MKTPVVNHEPTLLVPGLPALCAALLLAAQPAAATVSYDTDGDGLIEISSLAQLNAIRWDLDGDGAEVNGADVAYAAAFPDAAAGMGCPTNSDDSDDSDCTGYELTADLDFDTDGDGDVDAADEYWHSGAGWDPIGAFSATFEGNGHTIANLYINRSSGSIGLFGSVSAGGQVRNVAVRDVAVTGSGESWVVGGLVGHNYGSISSSNVTGSVTSSGGGPVGGLVGNNGRHRSTGSIVSSYATTMVTALGESQSAGGLVGYNGGSGSSSGSIVASYATGAVTASGNNSEVGGLVGFNGGSGSSRGSIVASYATGAVTGSGNNSDVGGLVGFNGGSGSSRGSIVASYATGAVTGSGNNSDVGGLAGFNGGSGSSTGNISNSYWNTETSGQASGSGDGVGKTTVELQTPTGYSGIYANWNRDLDGDGTADDPWDFGTASEYPVVRVDFDGDGDVDADDMDPQRLAPSTPGSTPAPTVSYDSDGDGLIEISTLAQLNAIRWDLDGDGAVDNAANESSYAAAFPDAVPGMGCPTTADDADDNGCTGYELAGDLDFDTDGDGDVGSADEYWNRSRGWEPVGSSGTGNDFTATFEGNGHTITRMHIDRSSGRIGLFGDVGSGGWIRNVGLVEVAVTGSGRGNKGGLVGSNSGSITSSYVTGSVTSTVGDGYSDIGGLVGHNGGSIVTSYATASVTGSSYHGSVGGLAGYNSGSIRASYATGSVTGTGRWGQVGGVVGFHNGGSIVVCYATGVVTGVLHVGGLVGKNWGGYIGVCYATGAVTGDDRVGGLAGEIQGPIYSSYATGWVTGTGSHVGGLVGRDYNVVLSNSNRPSVIRNSYWNTTTSGRVTSAGGEGKTTAELLTPTGYTGIYASWNLDLDNSDGDGDATTGGDDPWDFGIASDYPALQADIDGDGTATWQEFGSQRAGASTPTDAGSPDDATLKALGVSPVDVGDFSADVLTYHIGVSNEVSEVTVTPYLRDAGATIDINGSSVSSGSGHAVSLAEGSNEITITVTAQDGTTTRAYTITADRGSNAPFGWKVTEDFNDLAMDSAVTPRGIWSSGTTMWVACATNNDNIGANLCSYSMSTKERGVDFYTLGTHGNNSPMGIWSSGTTMWVADASDDKIYAYRMSNYSRYPSAEFNALRGAGNTSPTGIRTWAGQMVVADATDGNIYTYDWSTGSRGCATWSEGVFTGAYVCYEINTQAAGNAHPTGIWSIHKNSTLWVADLDDGKLYAYNRYGGDRDPSKDFNTLRATGNTRPWGIWSDGETMWVADQADKKIYSYNMPDFSDATLSMLTVSPVGIADFDSEVTAYHVGVANEVTEVTMTATVTTPGATIDINGRTVTSGSSHSVSLAEGRNDISITVTADDRQTTKVYTVTVVRSVTATFGWNAAADFNALDAAGNSSPAGIWSDGTTMWQVNTRDDKIYAYSVATKARDAAKDFDALNTAGNNSPVGLWSDGETMWVADSGDDKLYAYSLSTGARDTSKDFDGLKAAGNEDPAGIWSDDSTMWVVDDDDNHIYAYDLLTKARDSDKDFDSVRGAGSGLFEYIWSDGTTIWVANYAQSRLYAYDLSSGARDSSRDFTTLRAAGNDAPRGIWSDGTTMWVADWTEAKIYAYNMPAPAEPTPEPAPPADATLGNLSVSPVDIVGFSGDVATYHVGAANSVTRASITATPTDAGSTIDMNGSAVPSGSPYSLSLSGGRNEVTITVTASDSETQETYTVVIGRGVTTVFGWKATDDFNTLVPENNHPSGLWSDGTTMWVANYNNAPVSKIFAYDLSTKARDESKDFNTLTVAGNGTVSGNADPTGIWSDGTTMWVADRRNAKIYAYNLSTKARDAAKDFDTLSAAGNSSPGGIWSDGTTMWVVNHDNDDDKVFAYDLATKARDAARDIHTLRSDGIQRAFGLWSDGGTLWVGDSLFLRLFAYDRATKSRDSSRDFSALHPTLTHITLGIWSDGETMWVSDLSDKKIYSYNMPSKARATQAHATDFNGDGRTDFADFFLFIDAYGGTDARFDLDGNGTVDFADFFQFVDAFDQQGQAKLLALAQELIGLPFETELQQNAPNPFNSETVISWFQLKPGPAQLEVFSLTGQRVAVLQQGQERAGLHRLHWDGRDDEGRPLASGVYLYRLMTGEAVSTRKLTLLR